MNRKTLISLYTLIDGCKPLDLSNFGVTYQNVAILHF